MASKYAIETVFKIIDRISTPLDKIGVKGNRVGEGLKNDFAKGQKKLESLGKAAKKAAGYLAAAAGTAVIAFAVKGVKDAMDLGVAMAKVSTVADTSAVSLDALQAGLLKVSSVTGQAVGDLAAAQYEAISAGIDTASSVKFVEQAVKVAKGGFTDTTTAVNGLTTVLNAYGLKADQAGKISDQMIVAQNLGKTTFGEMANSIGNVIPLAASMNVGTDELFASIAALTSQGIGTSESITGMKAALSNIIKPTAEAAKMAKSLGLDFSASALQSKGLSGFLDDVAKATGGSQEKMAKLFGSVDALNSVTVLTGKGAGLFAQTLDAMANSAGATDAAFKKMQETPAARMENAMNKLTNAGIGMGTALLPVVEKLVDKVAAIADGLSGTDFGPLADGIGFVVDVVSVLLTVFWQLKEVILVVAIAWGIYQAAILAVAAAQAISNAVMNATPLGIAITIIAAVIAIIILLVKNIDSVIAVLQGIWNCIVNFVVGAFTALSTAISQNTEMVLGIVSVFMGPFVHIISIVREFADNWDRITAAFKEGGIVDGLKAIGGTLLSAILAPLQGILEAIALIPGADWAKDAAKGIQTLRSELTGKMSIQATAVAPPGYQGMPERYRTATSAPSSAAPITTGQQASYNRSETSTTSTTKVIVGTEKGSTARVSGGAPPPNFKLARQGF